MQACFSQVGLRSCAYDCQMLVFDLLQQKTGNSLARSMLEFSTLKVDLESRASHLQSCCFEHGVSKHHSGRGAVSGTRLLSEYR